MQGLDSGPAGVTGSSQPKTQINMPTEPIRPVKKKAEAHSALPAMEKMQRLKHDRMMRVPPESRVRAAVKWNGPDKLAHYHD